MVEADGRYTMLEAFKHFRRDRPSYSDWLLEIEEVCARWAPHLLTSDQTFRRLECMKKKKKKLLKFNKKNA